MLNDVCNKFCEFLHCRKAVARATYRSLVYRVGAEIGSVRVLERSTGSCICWLATMQRIASGRWSMILTSPISIGGRADEEGEEREHEEEVELHAVWLASCWGCGWLLECVISVT